MTKGIAFEFLDIGQGDATLVQLPPWDAGETFLVDFGKKSSRNEPVSDAIRFLTDRISVICHANHAVEPQLDYLCITHIDGDHWNQLEYLINGTTPDGQSRLWEANGWPEGSTLHIGQLIVGGAWEAYKKKNAQIAGAITAALQGRRVVEFAPAFSDDIGKPSFKATNTNIYVLSSNRSKGADPNPNSVVLMFEYQDPSENVSRKVILTGDAESAVVEPAIIEKYKSSPTFLNSYALKLGHHGSKGATSEAWVKAVLPKAVFASGDRYWGHPYCEAFARAVQYSVLAKCDKHRVCCGDANSTLEGAVDSDPKDYTNHEVEIATFSNLWYVVKVDKESGLAPADSSSGLPVRKEQTRGFYQGTQWRLQIDAGAAPFISCVPVWPLLTAAKKTRAHSLVGAELATQ